MLRILLLILFSCLIYFYFPIVEAAETPLVIVVHGVGGGNRQAGWSDEIAKQWNIGEVKEVTFRYEGRASNIATSFIDFSRYGGDWALTVQNQLQDIIKKNPDRPIMIISHSWGTVATAMALSGGVAGGVSKELESKDYNISPLNLEGTRIKEWMTLGSPLGRASATNVGGNLRQLQVYVPTNKPTQVDHWTNIYDPEDPVSNQSHQLADADENIKVVNSASKWRVVNWIKNKLSGGITAHTGIWTNPAVTEKVRAINQQLIAEQEKNIQPPLPKPAPTLAANPTTTPPKVEAPKEPVKPILPPTVVKKPAPRPSPPPPPVNKVPPNKTVANQPLPPPAKGNLDFAVLVVDKRGTPIPNVTIQIVGPVTGQGVGPAGKLIFKGVQEGTYKITVHAKGYDTEVMPLTVGADMGGEIDGVTGVTILLNKKPNTPTLPLQAQSVRETSFVGHWQGEVHLIKDNAGAKDIGKPRPLAIKIAAQGNNYIIYHEKLTLKNEKELRIIPSDNLLTILYQTTGLSVKALLTLDGDNIHVQVWVNSRVTKNGRTQHVASEYAGTLKKSS